MLVQNEDVAQRQTGKPSTAELHEKYLALGLTGQPKKNFQREKRVFDRDTGEFIGTCTESAKILGCSVGWIGRAAAQQVNVAGRFLRIER